MTHGIVTNKKKNQFPFFLHPTHKHRNNKRNQFLLSQTHLSTHNFNDNIQQLFILVSFLTYKRVRQTKQRKFLLFATHKIWENKGSLSMKRELTVMTTWIRAVVDDSCASSCGCRRREARRSELLYGGFVQRFVVFLFVTLVYRVVVMREARLQVGVGVLTVTYDSVLDNSDVVLWRIRCLIVKWDGKASVVVEVRRVEHGVVCLDIVEAC